jgi:hypothetical protein
MLGGLAKTAFVRIMRYPLAIVAAIIWVDAMDCCLALIHTKYGFAVAIPGMFWASVFFLGALVVSSQDLSAKNGNVHVKVGSPLYFVLTKWGGLDVCSLSWIGMLAIIGWPLLNLVELVAIIIWSFVFGFLLVGCNPFAVFSKSIEYGRADDSEPPMCICRVPVSPLMWAAVYGLVRLLVWLTKFPIAVLVYHIIGFCIAFCLIIMFLSWLVKLAMKEESFTGQQEATISYGPSLPERIYTGALQPTGRAIKTPFALFFQIMVVLKKKACPRILFD